MGKGSSTPSARELTAEEKSLISTQDAALKNAMDVAADQFNLSKEDREYISRIYRGDADPKSPEVQLEVSKRLNDVKFPTKEDYITKLKTTKTVTEGRVTKDIETITEEFDEDAYNKAKADYEKQKESLVRIVSSELGTEGVDEKLLKGVLEAKGEASTLFADWMAKAETLGNDYIKNLTGVSDSLKSSLTNASQNYTDSLATATGELASDIRSGTSKLQTELQDSLSAYKAGTASASNFFESSLYKTTKDYAKNTKNIAKTFEQKSGETTAEYQNRIQSQTTDYQRALADISGKYGTADQDILAQQQGQSMAGISQAFAEASKQTQSLLARRGLAGSGVEAQALGSIASQEAMAKAQAGTQAFNQSIALSDQRRAQQMGAIGQMYQAGIAGTESQFGAGMQNIQNIYNASGASAQSVYQAQQQAAQGIYGSQTAATSGMYDASTKASAVGYEAGQQAAQGIYGAVTGASGTAYNVNAQTAGQLAQQQQNLYGTAYGVQSGLAGQGMQNQINLTQQNLANLQMASGVGAGVYGMSQNYLAGASGTYGNTAATSGQTAVGIGNMQAGYQTAMYNADQAREGAMYGAITGAVSTGIGAYAGLKK